jgi:hypothetical protein
LVPELLVPEFLESLELNRVPERRQEFQLLLESQALSAVRECRDAELFLEALDVRQAFRALHPSPDEPAA